MFNKDLVGSVIFSALCLIGAAAVYFHPGDKAPEASFAWLIVGAAAPWALPAIFQFVKTIKVGGAEITMRDLQEATKALAASIPQAGAVASPDGVSHAIQAAEDDDEAPQKAQMASTPIAGGCQLGATVKPLLGSEDTFLIHAWVKSTDASKPLADGSAVRFTLPPFQPSTVTQSAVGGEATVDRVARKWFVIGAEVNGVRLSLPLNSLPGVSARFVG